MASRLLLPSHAEFPADAQLGAFYPGRSVREPKVSGIAPWPEPADDEFKQLGDPTVDLTTPQFDPPTILMPGVKPPAPHLVPAAPALAPAAPVETTRLIHQQRLVAVLRGAVEGFDLAGAELHLLDDTTAELRVVADYGAPPCPTPRPLKPRPLETAEADLAALSGGAVVLENAEMVAEWAIPGDGRRPCRAAVCVPVSSDIAIHGTLWLYSPTARPFSDREVQLIEIIAGRLAVEIERRRLLDRAR